MPRPGEDAARRRSRRPSRPVRRIRSSSSLARIAVRIGDLLLGVEGSSFSLHDLIKALVAHDDRVACTS